ncbi:hypothetical protein SAMD00019534_112520, partial [Acytostelium subglobosum LB1]|uniref:hypothetical protein n=1 Tax=Acytostelium subglobosum LB1 TaxID=1410327 RepID=UPI000645094D
IILFNRSQHVLYLSTTDNNNNNIIMEIVVSVGAPSADMWDGGSVREFYYTSQDGWPCIRSIDPVGKAFEFIWKRVQKKEPDTGLYEDRQADDGSSSSSSDDDGDKDEHFKKLKEKYQGKSKDWLKDIDNYEIMGLAHLRWRATENDIKNAYKKMILICHPDKNEGGSDEAFKSLQKAYDVLSDAKKRRAYDSKEPFDDSLPTSTEADRGDFFKVFEPVFEMNSRWSSVQPAPKVGDMNTPFDKVMKFYDFWWSFKSWRDFSFDDDYELDQADSRDEKRWMEKQNEKKRTKLRKDESARILELANMAYKRDPRVIKKQKDEEDAKNAAKQAKIDAKRKLEEEKEQKEREEKEQKEAEAKRIKEQELEKKNKRKAENRIIHNIKHAFRQLCYGPPKPLYMPMPTIEDVEFICGEMVPPELEQYTKVLTEADNEQRKVLFTGKLAELQEAKKERERQLAESKKAKQEEVESERIWTDEELTMLAKAIQKFPAGCAQRWESIATMIPSRTLKEVINKAKEAQPTKAFSKPVVQTTSAYDKFKSKVGDKAISSELSHRYEVAPVAAAEKKPAAAASTSTTTAAAAAPAAAAAAAPAVEKKKEEMWTPDEQKLLEEAMLKFDKTLTDRWDKIAEHVKRSKKDCVARYKYLVTLYKT